MHTDAILITAGFGKAATPRAANAVLTRIAPPPRRVPGRVAVRWTLSLGDPGRHAGAHVRSA